MKVLKFGGTSVGTVASLRNVKTIVEGLQEPAMVVVSALGGLTDKLITTAKNAAAGCADLDAELLAIRRRHIDIIDELVPEGDRDRVKDIVNPMLDELGGLFLGVSLINELPQRTLDRIVSFGERMSSVIVAAIIDGARHADSLEFIKTERWMDRNIAERSLTASLIKDNFSLPLENHVVTGGFISRDKESGVITNLGRGGSDYTAALIAAALDADSLEIWTDVDGFMTSDPRKVKEARVIPKMSFVESMELCSFGAKVIYPPTIYPVFHKNIPIRILNTHNPSAPGTLITDSGADLPQEVRGVSLMRDTAIVTVSGKLAANVAEINTRSYNAMTRAGMNVLLITKSECDGQFSLSLPAAEADKALEVLNSEFAPELGDGQVSGISKKSSLAIIAVVKEGIRKMEGLGARLYNTLLRKDMEVLGVSDGASDATVAVVVNDADADEALNLVHHTVIPPQ